MTCLFSPVSVERCLEEPGRIVLGVAEQLFSPALAPLALAVLLMVLALASSLRRRR